jgi:hypothetical protein
LEDESTKIQRIFDKSKTINKITVKIKIKHKETIKNKKNKKRQRRSKGDSFQIIRKKRILFITRISKRNRPTNTIFKR